MPVRLLSTFAMILTLGLAAGEPRAEEVSLSGIAAGNVGGAGASGGPTSLVHMSDSLGPDLLAATVSGRVTRNHAVMTGVSMRNTLELTAAERGIFVVQQSNGTGNLLQSVIAVAQPLPR